MTDQRDETGMHNEQDDDEGMGGQNIGDQGGSSSAPDWSMGQGDTATDTSAWQQGGGSSDNDGGTSGDYTSSEAGMGGESSHEQAERNPGG
jgi:hypothetical protein